MARPPSSTSGLTDSSIPSRGRQWKTYADYWSFFSNNINRIKHELTNRTGLSVKQRCSNGLNECRAAAAANGSGLDRWPSGHEQLGNELFSGKLHAFVSVSLLSSSLLLLWHLFTHWKHDTFPLCLSKSNQHNQQFNEYWSVWLDVRLIRPYSYIDVVCTCSFLHSLDVV